LQVRNKKKAIIKRSTNSWAPIPHLLFYFCWFYGSPPFLSVVILVAGAIMAIISHVGQSPRGTWLGLEMESESVPELP